MSIGNSNLARFFAKRLMRDTAIVERETQVSDSAGSYIPTSPIIFTEYGQLEDNPVSETANNSRWSVQGTHRWLAPHSTTIMRNDKITIAGKAFRVVDAAEVAAHDAVRVFGITEAN